MTILDLAHQAGISPKWVAGTEGGEFHSPCPKCGGTDRFRLQPYKNSSRCQGYYKCRKCEIGGDTISFCIDVLGMSFTEANLQLGIPTTPHYPYHNSNYNVVRKKNNAELKKPSLAWIKKAEEFTMLTHQQLLQSPDKLEELCSRGIPVSAVKKFKIGWNSKDSWEERRVWGLDQELNEKGNQKTIWLPKGFVIPTLELSGSIVRLKIRRTDYNSEDGYPKYLAIPGSMNGLNIFSNTKNGLMILVESEFDAIAAAYTASDLVFAVAIGGSTKKPDNVIDYYAKNKKLLLVCYDNDEAGKKTYENWKKLYPHAKGITTPYGKDIGEAIQMGLNLQGWLLELQNTLSECL